MTDNNDESAVQGNAFAIGNGTVLTGIPTASPEALKWPTKEIQHEDWKLDVLAAGNDPSIGSQETHSNTANSSRE